MVPLASGRGPAVGTLVWEGLGTGSTEMTVGYRVPGPGWMLNGHWHTPARGWRAGSAEGALHGARRGDAKSARMSGGWGRSDYAWWHMHRDCALRVHVPRWG